MAIVTLDEARARLQLRDDDVTQDTVLQAYCDAITPVVEEKANQVIEQRTITEDHDLTDPHAAAVYTAYGSTTTLWLRNPPVISISVCGNNGVTWSPVLCRSDGRLRVKSGTGFTATSSSSVAWYATVPCCKRAALESCSTWESRGRRECCGGVSPWVKRSPGFVHDPPKAFRVAGRRHRRPVDGVDGSSGEKRVDSPCGASVTSFQ
jgi:hypothetical protein